MLIIFLATWAHEHHVRYPSQETNQKYPYISDIGAQTLKPLFIAGCTFTAILLNATLSASLWRRRCSLSVIDQSIQILVLSILEMATSFLGTVGLISLSIWDTWRYPRAHKIFLGLFVIGYLLNAVVACVGYYWFKLACANPCKYAPPWSIFVKASFVIIATSLVSGEPSLILVLIITDGLRLLWHLIHESWYSSVYSGMAFGTHFCHLHILIHFRARSYAERSHFAARKK
jgi:hypothetical protein